MPCAKCIFFNPLYFVQGKEVSDSPEGFTGCLRWGYCQDSIWYTGHHGQNQNDSTITLVHGTAFKNVDLAEEKQHTHNIYTRFCVLFCWGNTIDSSHSCDLVTHIRQLSLPGTGTISWLPTDDCPIASEVNLNGMDKIYQLHKSCNAPVPYPIMCHSEQNVHISVLNGVLWDMV